MEFVEASGGIECVSGNRVRHLVSIEVNDTVRLVECSLADRFDGRCQHLTLCRPCRGNGSWRDIGISTQY
jgi:hypothetical protein